jgi:hypothetical protein
VREPSPQQATQQTRLVDKRTPGAMRRFGLTLATIKGKPFFSAGAQVFGFPPTSPV